MGYDKNEKIIIASSGKNSGKPGVKVPIEQKHPAKPAASQLVYQYDISLDFNDEQAILLFLAVSDRELLKDYVKTLDLRYYGEPIARGLSSWAESGWGSPTWNILLRGSKMNQGNSILPKATQIRAFRLHPDVIVHLGHITRMLGWFRQNKDAVKVEMVEIAAAVGSASAAAAPNPGVLNFNQVATAMDVFGERSEAMEMALRCLRSMGGSSSYSTARTDLEQIASWASKHLADIKVRKEIKTTSTSSAAGNPEFFRTIYKQ